MAHHQSAVKRIRTSAKRRLVNRGERKKLTTLTKAVRQAASKEEAEKALQPVLTFLDRAASKKIIHQNKAANQKSKLTRFVNRMEK